MNSEREEIRARIGTARLLLGQVGCPAKRKSASHTQCTALVDAVGRAKNMSKAEKAILGEQAMQIPWDVADAVTIAHAFSGDMPGSCRARHQLQDFENIHNFFREAEWDCLAHKKSNDESPP